MRNEGWPSVVPDITLGHSSSLPHSSFLFRDRIVHRVFAPWVAAQNTFHGQVCTFQNTPFLDRPDSVIGAGGLVAAFIGPQQRRQGQLIYADQQNEWEADDFRPHHNVNLYPTPRIEWKKCGFLGSSSKYLRKARIKLSIVRVLGNTS